MMLWVKYVWCRFVAFLMLRTFAVAVEEVLELRRTRLENDRLRVAFVRAKQVIAYLEKKRRHEAPTLPSMPPADMVEVVEDEDRP